MEQIFNHLNRLVSFYPATNQPENVLRLVNYCLDILKMSKGFEDAIIVTHNGIHSLYGSTLSSKKPKLVLQAHIDVVPAARDQQQMRREKGQLRGRGVFDMLYATACYLTFIESHQQSIHNLDFGIMLTGDEEVGGFNGVNHFLKLGYSTDICVLPDAGLGFGDLNAAAKGVYNFDLVVNGIAHHGARPWEGDGAGNKLILLISELTRYFDDSSRDNSTLTVSKLSAGDADNKGPATATARLDIRYRDQQDLKKIQSVLEKLCDTYHAHIADLQVASDYQLDTQNPLVKQFVDLYETHAGHAITLSKAHGSSDARFFAAKNIPVIMLRPSGGGGHGDNEWISIAEIEKFYKLLEEYIMKAAQI